MAKLWKQWFYPTIISGLTVIILVLLVGRFDVVIQVEPVPPERFDGLPERSPLAESADPLFESEAQELGNAEAGLANPSQVETDTEANRQSEDQVSTPTIEPDSNLEDPLGDRLTAEGQFRVSNQTQHPIRVALLSQEMAIATDPSHADLDDVESADISSEIAELYQQPVHWDFAPREGGLRGLILSLPDRDLVLQPGDVLVAFAQDGSRRYWGPYVVGSTSLPIWNSDNQEWQLVLQP